MPAGELKGKRVLLRTGMDLPIDEQGNVSDIFDSNAHFRRSNFFPNAERER